MAEPSPFPFRQNAEIHLFSDLEHPPSPMDAPKKHELYLAQQVTLCEYYLQLNHGRALILCTSRYFMEQLFIALHPLLLELGVTGYVQTPNANVKELLSDFVSDESSVLFGVESCWEGLDAPGDTLKTLIITRVPFTPLHPVTDARIQQLEEPEQGFWEVMLPDMLLRMKQGAGRLIRSSTDTGVIAILDSRVITKSYGRHICESLPPARILRDPVRVLEYLSDDIERHIS